jgi:hypothetical protein
VRSAKSICSDSGGCKDSALNLASSGDIIGVLAPILIIVEDFWNCCLWAVATRFVAVGKMKERPSFMPAWVFSARDTSF